MKAFNLSEYHKNNNNKKYYCWFGNSNCISFNSKREMSAFLADTNRFLNDNMIELNEIYINIFREYRSLWFCMLNQKNGTMVNLLIEEKQIQDKVMDIMFQFNKVGNSNHGATSSQWSLKHLHNICYMFVDLLKMLIDINKKKNNIYTYHSLRMITKRVQSLELTILNYPEEIPEGGTFSTNK